MDDTLLRGHTCLHCQKLNLCGETESVFVNTNLNLGCSSSSWPMRFTGVYLSDLQEGARNGCSLGKYLASQLGEGYPESLSPHDLKVYIDDWHFHGLIPLEKTLSRDQKPEFPMNDHYVSAPSHKGKVYAEYPTYHITTDQKVECDELSRSLLTRKPMVADPLSDVTAASIRKWKVECDFSQSQAHKICAKPSPKFLPNRLIEIVRIDNDHKPCVRLVEGSSLNADTEYTALSYCWGGDLKNCLKEGNKNSYRTEVPWKHIPRTIQDAILTSHKLGIEFIWVDSLCIIQDSKTADKDIEIGQMTQVYTHAALTIAARRAPDADAGFLHPRSVPSGTTIVEFRDDNGETRRGTLTFEAAERYEDQNILDTRGWTLQEYVLSRRLLIIGSWTTTWSCRQQRKGNCDGWSLDRDLGDPFQNDAFWASGDNTEFAVAHPLDAIALFSTHPGYDQPRREDHLIKWEWYELVNLYTRRNLTKKTDRILAISGLAQIFSPMRGGEYAAGLWVKDMPETLLWENCSAVLDERPSGQGPSWSWTAINGIVKFSKSHDQNVLSVECIECELGQPGVPFGYVKRGALRATGPALDLQWKYCTSSSSCTYYRGHYLRYSTPDRGYVDAPIVFCPDAKELDSDWTTVTLLAVKADECIDSMEGLVLRKKDDTNYSRLGYYSGSSHPHIDCPLPMVKKWGLRTFTIV